MCNNNYIKDTNKYNQSQSQNQKFILRKEIYIEHRNILTAIHDQDWSKVAIRISSWEAVLIPF